MSPELRRLLGAWHPVLESRLAGHLPLSPMAGASALNDAVRYAVFPGGRRWRPSLTLLGAFAARVPPETAFPAACGIEYLHTASLVLDDLPSMDDGQERRGRPTLHRVFGEGIATLAALALLNRGYELFLPAPRGPRGDASRLMREAMRAIGSEGMVGGQAADLCGGAADLAQRQPKTTSLVRLATMAGAVAGGAPEGDIAALARFGECLGHAYQIHDDLVDGRTAPAASRKTINQDARHGRPTWTARGQADATDAAAAALEAAAAAVAGRFGNGAGGTLLVEAAAVILETVTGAPAPARRTAGATW